MSAISPEPRHPTAAPGNILGGFTCELVDRVRETGGVWRLEGGELILPQVFGFCRGVKRALTLLDEAVSQCLRRGTRIILLGEIIHNPWVNRYFEGRGVRILSRTQRDELEKHIRADDCAIIPAFGVLPEVERRLERIGCQIVDSTCGDVLRLWKWARHAAGAGYGVIIYGRPNHDETVVTRARLAEAGGKYLVLPTLDAVDAFCRVIRSPAEEGRFPEVFDERTTNAAALKPFLRLAQVSQTTMLYSDTMLVRERIGQAFAERFGEADAASRLLFQPTVCRATQQRQESAVELVQSGCDLMIVVGGAGSSNTRHLYELALGYTRSYFIEDPSAIRSATELESFDFATDSRRIEHDWLPSRRPVRIGLLAGASTPEILVGQTLERLAEVLAGAPQARR